MHRLDETLSQLMSTGLKQGFLYFSQVHDYLPNEAEDPRKLDYLIMVLEELDMEVRTDPIVYDENDDSQSIAESVVRKFDWKKTLLEELKIRFGCI